MPHRSACVPLLLALLCLLALSFVTAAASDRIGALHATRKLGHGVASQPALDEAAATAAAATLSHPAVKSLEMKRSVGPSRKARARAAAGHPAYQHILKASEWVADVNAQRHAEEAAALQRHTERVMAAATNGSALPVPPPTVAPLEGCPFSDFTIPVAIGASVFQLLIDTGSSTLALAGSACTTCSNVNPKWARGAFSSVHRMLTHTALDAFTALMLTVVPVKGSPFRFLFSLADAQCGPVAIGCGELR